MIRTRTIYVATIKVSLTVEGDHNPALIASDIAAALPSDITTTRGETLHFDPVPHVVERLAWRSHGRGWRRLDADQQAAGVEGRVLRADTGTPHFPR